MNAKYALLDRLADAAGEIGHSCFHRKLRDAIAAHVKADLSMVMHYSRQDAPVYLTDDGLVREHMDLYLKGLYRIDPIYRLCRDGVSSGVLDLQEMSSPIAEAGNYFDIFLRMTGMADDLAILLPLPDGGGSLGLVFERNRDSGRPKWRRCRASMPCSTACTDYISDTVPSCPLPRR
ncbi:MAG: hypothetical protein U1E67_22665 [Hyphomicrobiales bacterium]